MEKIKKLLEEMDKINHKITLINFYYNKLNYFLILEKLKKIEKINKYASIKLTFIREKDQKEITIEANSSKFLIDRETLIKYFEVDSNKINDFSKYLFVVFINSIPENIPNLNDKEKKIIINYINKQEKEEEKIYCTGLMRNGIKNGKQNTRTPLNLEKTRILYPKLYENFKNDETISFKYSSKTEDEKEYLEILENFYKQK
ncbi:DUF6037 family protein [Fusobacterium sp.]|uniref:DUF6037 family protein n=1 Tax=Fusobacterium sp. TaxID=68766 RepID=UPI0029020ED6|nr:DUF6037 family protein [Fusobacterium sp.]MDU1912206.1 DUF6037 family protein [Fusobacterium sp.]